jgi:hypothetical protein
MVILFRREHVDKILAGTKTHTRRVWKRPRVKPGGVYQARTKMLDKGSTFALLRVLRAWRERLLDISEEDARKEGYESREAFFEVFKRINKMEEIPENFMVYAIEFRVV